MDENPWTMSHFSMSAPGEAAESRDVPRLLRNVADELETLGEIEIFDITFNHHFEPPDITVSVYYERERKA